MPMLPLTIGPIGRCHLESEACPLWKANSATERRSHRQLRYLRQAAAGQQACSCDIQVVRVRGVMFGFNVHQPR